MEKKMIRTFEGTTSTWRRWNYICDINVNFSELHSIRRRAWRTFPILDPTLKYFGGTCLVLLRRDLKVLTVFAFLISSERSFQARIADGKKELKKILVRARIDWTLSELRRLSGLLSLTSLGIKLERYSGVRAFRIFVEDNKLMLRTVSPEEFPIRVLLVFGYCEVSLHH